MPARPRLRRRVFLGGAALAAATAGLAGVTLLSRHTPEGPEPVAWDREACVHCRMLIGDPSFAAQIIETEGPAKNFDDPGCLFEYLDQKKPAVHRIWFHHSSEDRWIAKEDVGFTRSPRSSPMGFDLGAVELSVGGALDFEATTRIALRREASQEASR